MSQDNTPATAAVAVLHAEQSIEELRQRYGYHLAARGNAVSTIRIYIGVLDHFSRWLACQGVDLVEIDDGHVVRFLEHLPECRCPMAASRDRKMVRAALHQWLWMLGRATRSRRWSVTIAEAVTEFDVYMETVAGLAEATRFYRRRCAGEFLQHHFEGRAVELERLHPAEVRKYVVQRAQGLAPVSAGVLGTALRSFLRYTQLRGRCAPALARAVPGPAARPQTQSPRALEVEVVERVLASFDRGVSTGIRDYAMCRCLTDLGMRTSDVAHLRLEDLDWHRGTIHVPAGKSRRPNILPLPPEMGRAITDYVLGARPMTDSRALFVHHRARSGHPISETTVRAAIRLGFARAGIAPTLSQVHRLRHSTATRLLQTGTSFKTIADILGHASVDTTARYLSVDTPRLRAVAMPWPGGA